MPSPLTPKTRKRGASTREGDKYNTTRSGNWSEDEEDDDEDDEEEDDDDDEVLHQDPAGRKMASRDLGAKATRTLVMTEASSGSRLNTSIVVAEAET